MSNNKMEIPVYTEESETEASLAAKRAYFYDKTINVPLAQAWEAGCAYGWASAIPWKKPSERPDFDFIILAQIERHPMSGPYIYQGKIEEINRRQVRFVTRCLDAEPEEFEWKYVRCWCYADELSLPEWVKK